MTNGRVVIHDLFNDHNEITTDAPSTGDTVEFRILMAYAQRRRQKDTTSESSEQHRSNTAKDDNASGSLPSSQTEETVEKNKQKKKKRKIWKRLPKVLVCLKPQTKDEMPSPCDEEEEPILIRTFRAGKMTVDKQAEEPQEDQFGDVATRLAEISAEIPFVPPDIETDSSDEVEKVIGLLLRDAGDKLDKELKDTNIVNLLGNYTFFEKVILSLWARLGLSTDDECLGAKVSPKTQMAVTCEATTRLSVLDTLPVSRLFGHGARFLQDYFSSWAEQHGGYENVFVDEDDEVH